jgi:DNA-binding IclR family transcriptional regulator
VKTLALDGYLTMGQGKRYFAGPRLIALLNLLDEKQVVANVAAPILHRLAGQIRSVVQLGTFENDMVTYRLKTGQGAGNLFTRVGMQLEAYCSGMGKVLLAHLPLDQREVYITNGEFIPLTDNTIIEPEALIKELEKVLAEGYAIDDSEIADGLRCLAVPIRRPDGRVLAAISASQSGPPFRISDENLLRHLLDASKQIESLSFC